MRSVAFWDASALVPLCVRQVSSSRVVALFHLYDVAVWWGTPVEIASALARLLRMKQLDSSDWTKSRRLADRLGESWAVIQPSDAVRAKALQLVTRYDLRAADSFQLAAALEWCEEAPEGLVFLTMDGKLREAALISGFDAKAI